MTDISRIAPSTAATLARASDAPASTGGRFGATAGSTVVVRAGDTLSTIAQRHGTSWQRLAEINGLRDPDHIRPGQRLILPSGPSTSHTVRPGETLAAIARAEGVSVAALARANGVRDPDRIQAGQVLTLPAARSASSTTIAMGEAGPARAGGPQPGAASRRAADLAEAGALPRSAGKCYRYVKLALQQSGAVADYLPGVAAKGAGPELERRGFVNILGRPGAAIRSPYDAPKGAVLVYGAAPGAADKNARYGHIEIRTGTGFASDYASARARTGAESNGLANGQRVLIGVYVKP